MAQDNYDEDSEYQLNDQDDAVFDVDNTDSQKPSSGEGEKKSLPKVDLSRKKIIATLFIVILILLIGYKLFSLVFGTKHHKEASAKSTTEISALAQQNSTAIIPPLDTTISTETKTLPVASGAQLSSTNLQQLEQSISPSSVAVPQKTEETTVEKKESAGLSQEDLDKIIGKLEEILNTQQYQSQNQFSSLEDQITNLGSSLSGLQSSIQNLTSQLQQTKLAQENLARTKVKIAQETARKVRTHTRYYVEAVIPGRAWLRGADGGEVTVTMGDVIPGYGKVLGIDSYSGTISTSSGEDIYYGVSD